MQVTGTCHAQLPRLLSYSRYSDYCELYVLIKYYSIRGVSHKNERFVFVLAGNLRKEIKAITTVVEKRTSGVRRPNVQFDAACLRASVSSHDMY